jgi:hypothetical protein
MARSQLSPALQPIAVSGSQFIEQVEVRMSPLGPNKVDGRQAPPGAVHGVSSSQNL